MVVRLDGEIERRYIPWALSHYSWVFAAWQRIPKYGLPYVGGWAEHPAVLMDLFDTLDNAHNQYLKIQRDRHEQREKAKRNRL